MNASPEDPAGPAAAPLNVSRSVIHGTAWMVGMRWAIRGLGLINTFVLARLLLPADFGLVAMAMLVVGLIEMFGQTGQLLALIRHPNPTRAHYDSVWTLTILIAIGLTVVLWLISPLASLYFHEARAGDLVRVLALRTLIGGFANVGTIAFRKDLEFHKEFRFQILQRVGTLVATVGFALWLRDYWALAGGILVGQLLTVLLSYVAHPYRPRFAISKIAELFSFSGWMLLVHTGQYLQDKADEIVLGGLTTPAALGTYNVAADSATAPTIEVVMPMTRALFPIFARISHDTEALRDAFLNVFSGAAIICAASATGMALVAPDFVEIALGPKWTGAIPLIEVLAFSGGLYGVMHSGITLLSASGHARLGAMLTNSRMIVTFAALIAAGLWGGVMAVAVARLLVTAAFLPGIFLTLSRVLPITPGDMVARVWRPLIAAAAMAGALLVLHPAGLNSAVLRLLLDMAMGATVFTATMYVLWRLSGRPPGPEAGVADRLARLGPRWLAGSSGIAT